MAEAKSAFDSSMLDAKSGSGVSVPEAATPAASPTATPAASPTATVANTLTHEHYVHLTIIVSSIVDVFKGVHNISDEVELDLEKVTSTFEAAFLQMMKEGSSVLVSSGSSVKYSVGSNSTLGSISSCVGSETSVKVVKTWFTLVSFSFSFCLMF